MSSYKKLSIEEIQARFAQAKAEPSMRSVTAILRITREQVGARGFLWHYPKAAIGAGVLTVALGMAVFVVPETYRSKLLPTAIGCAIIAVVLSYSALSSAHDRRTATEQEGVLRQTAAEAIDEILSTPFARKPLEWEHVGTLRELSRAHPECGRLGELLADASARAG